MLDVLLKSLIIDCRSYRTVVDNWTKVPLSVFVTLAMEPAEEGQVEVERLKRLLYTGSTTSMVRLPFRITSDTAQKLQQHVKRVSELGGHGKVNLPFQLCKCPDRAKLIDEDMLFLALSCCLTIENKETKTQVYSHLKKILVENYRDSGASASAEQNGNLEKNPAPAERFLQFKYLHRLVFKKKQKRRRDEEVGAESVQGAGLGLGKGMKKLVQSWYKEQDAFELAVETQRVHSRHKWSHADLIKLHHVTAKGVPAKEAVLDTCLRGFDFMQKKLEGNSETTGIMDYMKAVRKLKSVRPSKANNGTWDPEEAIRLINQHSFDIDILPTEQLQEEKVWEVRNVLYIIC